MSHRAPLAATILVVFGISLAGLVARLPELAGASDWGSDWRWLEDGLQRLAAGEPLTRPAYVAGPFSQFVPGPTYTWSLHPPYTATLIAPSLLLPAALRAPAWTLLVAAALAAALWTAWPRGLWRGTHLLVAAAFLGPPLVGLSAGLVDQLHYANPNGLVALGIVTTWSGRRRGSPALIALGLVLAAIKVVPAVALGTWLISTRHNRRPSLIGLAAAGLALAALTAPVLLIDPGAVGDTLAAWANLVPTDGATNLAPRVGLASLLGLTAGTLLSEGVAVALLGLVLARHLDGAGGLVIATSATLLLTPQLWSHWFLVPAVAVLVAAGQWTTLRRADETLRTAWESGPEALATG
jgi:hypothetical protein